MELTIIIIGTVVALFGMLVLAGLNRGPGVMNPPAPAHLKAPGPPSRKRFSEDMGVLNPPVPAHLKAPGPPPPLEPPESKP